MVTMWVLKIFVCCVAGFALAARGEEKYRETAFVESKVVDSFSIGVRDEDGFTNSAPDRRLTFAIWSTHGPAHVVLPAQAESAYRVELFDSNGVTIAKTQLGKEVGIDFTDFGESALKKDLKVNAEALKKSELASWMVIFRPADLFEIDKPGNYMLRIQFQIIAFPRTGPNRGDYAKRLIRFPPLDYPLVQPKRLKGR